MAFARRLALKGPGYDDEAPLGLKITGDVASVMLTNGKHPPAKPILGTRTLRKPTWRFARGCFAAAQHDGVDGS